MKPTHQFTDSRGNIYRGVIVAPSVYGCVWFLPLCDDGETWMKEPVWAAGVLPIQ